MEQPLVSIVVITYNSAKTVAETLDSAKNQTYKNIELIVSDDCSTDETVEICRNWIDENKDRFVRTELITVEKNTGVPGNCNRGIRKCSSEWIKLIAGDDILLDNCISDFVDFVNLNKDVDIVYSLFHSFHTENGLIIKDEILPLNKFNKVFSHSSNQLKTYLDYARNITPSLFYKKELIVKMGYYNEAYKLFEDTPMISKILSQGIHIYFLDKETVLYRKDTESITRFSDNQKYFYKRTFVDTLILFKKECIYEYYKKSDMLFWIKEYSFLSTYYFTIYVLRNRKNKFTLSIYYIFKLLNPYYCYKKIKGDPWL